MFLFAIVILTCSLFCSDEYGACNISQNAVLLMEAHAHLTIGLQSKERLLLLFTDSLIITKTKYVSVGVNMSIYMYEMKDICLSKCMHCVLRVTGLCIWSWRLVLASRTYGWHPVFTASQTESSPPRTHLWLAGRPPTMSSLTGSLWKTI